MGNQDKKARCPQCHYPAAMESRYCPRCGFPLQEKQKTLTYTSPTEKLIDDKLQFSPGESFGLRYRIIEEAGRGGMGRIYKAEDKELGITVALKMIRPEYSSHPRFIQQFKKETLLARSISQENVIRIHDLGEIEDIKFISMDYIKGQSLKELIQASGTLTAETSIKITRQICFALSAAHQKGIVHLDLKPGNIMIDNDGKVFVMDFGVAKSVAAREEGLAGGIIGTPPYISPEHAKREKVDHRADIYSLGIIIFEMLTGKRPFEAKTSSEYIEKHLYTRPPSPSKINPLTPTFLERIILRCLEKDRDKRYQSVKEVLKDLEEYKEASRAIPAQHRKKKLLKYASIIPLILLVALGIYLLIWKRKPTPSAITPEDRISLAVMYFENNTGENALNHWQKALSDMIIQDLSQSMYIKVLPGERLYDILKELNLLEARRYSAEQFKRIASLGRIRHILYGNYTRAKDFFRIDIMLRDINSGELVASRGVRGKGEESFFSMVDELTPWIKSKLDLTRREIAADMDGEIGKIYTNSPEANRHYIIGKQYYQEGKYLESNEAFSEAIRIDPGFALAYRRISENYHYLGKIDLADKYIHDALSLVDRISFRERLLIQAWAYTILESSYEKAIETYKELLHYYPNDEYGHSYLGAIYRNLEEWDLALEHFNKIFYDNPLIALENYRLIYMAKGLYDELKEILQSQNNYLSPAMFHANMSIIYLCEGKYDLALREVEDVLSQEKGEDRLLKLRGHIYHIQGDFQESELTYRKLLEKEDPNLKNSGHFWLACLYLTRGQYEKCKDEITQGINDSTEYNLKPTWLDFLLYQTYLNIQTKKFTQALDSADQAIEAAAEINYLDIEIFALHLKGIAYIHLGKISEAKNIPEHLKRLIEKTQKPVLMRNYYHLAGMIAAKEKMLAEAIAAFEKALELLPKQSSTDDDHVLYHYFLSLSYYHSEDWDRAREQFEKITSLTTGRLKWGDLYAKSFYWLGKLYQNKGWTGRAVESYKKFLEIWDGADPTLPELMDARKQSDLLEKRAGKLYHELNIVSYSEPFIPFQKSFFSLRKILFISHVQPGMPQIFEPESQLIMGHS